MLGSQLLLDMSQLTSDSMWQSNKQAAKNMKLHSWLPDQDLGDTLGGDAQVFSEEDNARLQCVLYTQLKGLRRALDDLAALSSTSLVTHGDQAAAVAMARGYAPQ